MAGSGATILPIYNKDPSKYKLTERNIKKYINGIYNGTITERDLSLDVYNAITDYLKAGLYDGYGMTLAEAEGADLRLLSELRENVYMFGAAKNYQMTKEISSLLVNEETGEVRTAKEFNDLARETYDNWNDNWGLTEYNTAIGQGEAASKWNEIEKDAEVLPNLRYSAVLDANTSDICAPLDGLIAPVDDPIWSSVAPLNHFNCRCVLLQEGPDAKLTPKDDKDDIVGGVLDEMQGVFKSNPGKTGNVFDKDHPYFDVPKKDKAYAKRNFDMPIPPADSPSRIIPGKPTEPEVTPESAIKDYTGSWAYPKIQAYLRNGIEGESIDYIKDLINGMDAYLDQAPKFEGTVYRGLQFDKKDKGFKELIKGITGEGAELMDKSFMSTTSDPSILQYFVDHPGKHHVVFTIEGKSGVDISHLSRSPGEKEVLFGRNIKFKVVSYEEKDTGLKDIKHYNVKLKEI